VASDTLAVVLALIACLSVAFCIGELARHLPSAGGMYTYVARGLHPSAGSLVAWGYAFAEPLGAPLLYLHSATTASRSAPRRAPRSASSR